MESAISIRHNLATSGEPQRYVVAFTCFAGGSNWLRQQSLRHIVASHGYAPGTIAVNVTWIERGFNAGQTTRSIYLQPFPSNSTRKFKKFAILLHVIQHLTHVVLHKDHNCW